MAIRRLLLAPVLVLVVVGATGDGPVGASCIASTIQHAAGTVDRADTLHVEGSGWGERCYDTGAPPEGMGVLGPPRQRIEIVLVQGEVEHVVATGNADDRYRFSVDVPVPDALEPGPVAVVARLPGGDATGGEPSDPLLVSEAAPGVGGASDEPVTFGPPERPTAAADPDDGRSLVGVIVVGAVVLALTAAVGVLFARSRQGPRGPRLV